MPDLAEKLLRAMGRELERLKSRPLSRKEIDDARLQIKGSLILSKQDVEVRMKRLARQFIAMGEILSYEECYSIIDSITETDIEALTGEIFDKGGSNLFVYGCKGLKKLSKKKFEIGNKMQGNKRELTTDEHG
jgi:predicted Zn-dependent peptidase